MDTKTSNDRGLADRSPRHYVRVPAPNAQAGIGDALRHAFHMNGESHCLTKFEDLLRRLD